MRILIAVLSLSLFVNSSYAQEADPEKPVPQTLASEQQSPSEKAMSEDAPEVKKKMHKTDSSKHAKRKIGDKDPTVCKKNDKACLAKAAANSDKVKIEIADKEKTSTDKAKSDFSKDKASELDNILIGEDRY